MTDTDTELRTSASAQADTFNGLIIQPSKGWSSLGLKDLWEYRELGFFLVSREIKSIYRQTALGMSWLFIRPILNMLLLSVVFGYLIKVPSDGVPYPLFSLSALIPWGYFSNAVLRASRSLVDNTQVVSKVYFPRMLLPLASVVSGLVDMAAALIVFLVALLLYRMPLRIEMLTLPLFIMVAVAFAMAFGLWLATLSVIYRDVTFAITFILQALMYASPVIYPMSIIPPQLQKLYALNPMTGVIVGFRWALLGSGEPPGWLFVISVAIIAVALVSGAYVFRRTERKIVDVL
jgi:lipopolysaccharide transport system permease protein